MAECNGCGAHVTPAFVRVFGNNDGNINKCIRCGLKTNDRRI